MDRLTILSWHAVMITSCMASLSVADDSTDLEIFLTLSLEELMAIRIDIDSIRTKPVQQQPSSVTIITQQQIVSVLQIYK